MTELRELLRSAAPRPDRPVDVASLRRGAQRRRRQRSIATVAAALLGVGGVATAVAARADDDSSTVGSQPVTLWCGVSMDGQQASTQLDPTVGPATASIGGYDVEFSVVQRADGEQALRADVKGPSDDFDGPNPDLPPGVILRAEGGYHPEQLPDPDGVGFFFAGGGLTGGCGPSFDTTATPAPTMTPGLRDWLTAYNDRSGIGRAHSARWVLTTSAEVAREFGGAVTPGDAPIFVVDLIGDFSWEHSCPAGSSPSACRSVGDHLVLTLDATTLDVLSTAIASTPPDLAKLGSVGEIRF